MACSLSNKYFSLHFFCSLGLALTLPPLQKRADMAPLKRTNVAEVHSMHEFVPIDVAAWETKSGICSRSVKWVKHVLKPRIPVAAGLMAILTVVICAVCISVVSEKLYRRTLSDFAESALNSVVTRVVIETSKSLRDMESVLDEVVFATRTSARMVPSAEEEEMKRAGLEVLNPSRANVSSGMFPSRLCNTLSNSSLSISTWRVFYGSLLSSIKLAATSYYSNFEVVFLDGTFLSMVTETVQDANSQSIALSQPTLYDGIYLPPPTNSGSFAVMEQRYYVRKTPLIQGVNLEFRQSYIVPSDIRDRRTEEWYTRSIAQNAIKIEPARRWSQVYFNATTGFSFIDLVASLDTSAGSIGKARLSLNVDLLAWLPREYLELLPMPSVKILIISYDSEMIIGSLDFNNNSKMALSVSDVKPDYTLSTAEQSINCVLTPSTSGSYRMKTCRHTVSSYGDSVVIKGWEATRKHFNVPALFVARPSGNSKMTGKTPFNKPLYKPFTNADGRKYFVSVSAIASETLVNPKLVTMVIAPESEVIGVLGDVRIVVIYVAFGLTVFLTIFFIVGSVLIFSPLNTIANQMKRAAHLFDNTISPENEDGSGRATRFKMFQLLQQQRTPSRWFEVRLIQESYWTMSDELKALMGYIPEHVREKIIEKHREESELESHNTAVEMKNVVLPSATAPVVFSDNEELSQMSSTTPMAGTESEITLWKRVVNADCRTTASCTSAEGFNNAFLSTSSGSEFQEQKETFSHFPHASPLQKTNDDNDIETQIPSMAPVNRNNNPLSPTAISRDKHILESPFGSSRKIEILLGKSAETVNFSDKYLVDRKITIVHLNIIGFHKYILKRRYAEQISADMKAFITYIASEAKRFGGVLEDYMSDKLWISFDATTKCTNHEIAACYFAHSVTSVINHTVTRYTGKLDEARKQEDDENKNSGKVPVLDSRFVVCAFGGINCGVASGDAFVGPIGNSSIMRHGIISNALSQAASLERQGRRYHGANVVISHEIIPAIDSYIQYSFLDVSRLPSDGRPVTIAVVRGPILGEGADISVVQNWLHFIQHQDDDNNHEGAILFDNRFVLPLEKPKLTTRGHKKENFVKKSTYICGLVAKTNLYKNVNDALTAAFYKSSHSRSKFEVAVEDRNRLENFNKMVCSEEIFEHIAFIDKTLEMCGTFYNLPDNYSSAFGDMYIDFDRKPFLRK